MTHVFVVDDNTFKYHLEYMFAGTGANEKQSTFLTFPQIERFPAPTERNLVSMIADISRIRIGDNIIFYLQANTHHEGTFFGVFQAISNPFFDENDNDNYLKNVMGKGLSFRVLIQPHYVFQLGISERELLDNIRDKVHPYQLCWSLIYRKLKGNRGCTMIMDYEFEDLWKRLMIRNHNVILQGNHFTYDVKNNTVAVCNTAYCYGGRQSLLDIGSRMKYKANCNNSFETHLQAYIIQQIALKNLTLYYLLGIDLRYPFWLGNEVACGVGMQRIDILLIQEVDNHVKIIPIELKDEPPNLFIFNQINWYVEWIRQYVVPNYGARDKHLEIIPYIVAKGHCSSEFLEKLNAFEPWHNRAFELLPCQYIEFEIDNTGITFNKKA